MSLRFRVKEIGRPIWLREALPYLDARGWKRRDERGLIVCEGPADDAGDPIVAFVPNDETCPDYPLRIEDLISILSTLEERPAAEIANEMAEAHASALDESPTNPNKLVPASQHSI